MDPVLLQVGVVHPLNLYQFRFFFGGARFERWEYNPELEVYKKQWGIVTEWRDASNIFKKSPEEMWMEWTVTSTGAPSHNTSMFPGPLNKHNAIWTFCVLTFGCLNLILHR